MGPSSTCATDFIEFLYSDPVSGDLILQSRFCGGDETAKIVGQTNSMVVRYVKTLISNQFTNQNIFLGIQEAFITRDTAGTWNSLG